MNPNSAEALIGTSTLRALAWSEEADDIAEPVAYSQADDQPSSSPASRLRLPALLFGIAAGAATIAVGGLVLTLTGTGAQPAPAATIQTGPEVNLPGPRANAEDVSLEGVSRSSLPVTAGSPTVKVVPHVANAPRPLPSAPGSAPVAVTAAPVDGIPPSVVAASDPAESSPSGSTPAPLPPQVSPVPPVGPPVFVPPVSPVPPVVSPVFIPPVSPVPPVVSPVFIPPVLPDVVPHPVGPPVFHVPDAAAAPDPSLPSLPVVQMPAVSAATNPGIGLAAGTTLMPLVPKVP